MSWTDISWDGREISVGETGTGESVKETSFSDGSCVPPVLRKGVGVPSVAAGWRECSLKIG
jgi:hypothetical protein